MKHVWSNINFIFYALNKNGCVLQIVMCLITWMRVYFAFITLIFGEDWTNKKKMVKEFACNELDIFCPDFYNTFFLWKTNSFEWWKIVRYNQKYSSKRNWLLNHNARQLNVKSSMLHVQLKICFGNAFHPKVVG